MITSEYVADEITSRSCTWAEVKNLVNEYAIQIIENCQQEMDISDKPKLMKAIANKMKSQLK